MISFNQRSLIKAVIKTFMVGQRRPINFIGLSLCSCQALVGHLKIEIKKRIPLRMRHTSHSAKEGVCNARGL